MAFVSVLLLVCFLGFGGGSYKDTSYRLERSRGGGHLYQWLHVPDTSSLGILLNMEHEPCFTEHRCVY